MCEEVSRGVEERLKAGEKAELVEELKRMEEYLAIYHLGEVDDLKVNIDFKVAKINVLKDCITELNEITGGCI